MKGASRSAVVPLTRDSVLERVVDRLCDASGADIATVGTDLERLALECFATPRALEHGIAALQRHLPERDHWQALAVIIGLVEAGHLAPTEQNSSSKPARSRGFFGVPRPAAQAIFDAGSVDAAFLGVPYALGSTGRVVAQDGPSYLRRCSSRAFDFELRAGIPAGWWHPGQQARVMEGVELVDLGDIDCSRVQRNGRAFDDVYSVVSQLCAAGAVPVTVGGDHSISLPAITATAKTYPGLGVLQLDAHYDMADPSTAGAWRPSCTHGNFMTWVVRNRSVASLTQFGIRHLLSDAPIHHEKVVSIGGGPGFKDRWTTALDRLPTDRSYYLTFDVDCLDLGVVSQTGTPVPGGLTYHSALELLSAITSRLDVVAVDVVELGAGHTSTDLTEGVAVSYLLFELLAGLFANRGSR